MKIYQSQAEQKIFPVRILGSRREACSRPAQVTHRIHLKIENRGVAL